MKNAIALLTAAGFHFNPEHGGAFGTIAPEPFNVGKDHFFPHFRGVYIGKSVGGFYVTSHIVGDFRRYRQRVYNTQHNASLANIFGGGKTALEAVKIFLANFKSKTYNRAT